LYSRYSLSDDPLQNPTQELDLGDSDDDDEPAPTFVSKKRSKQLERPSKIIPTASDASDSSSDSEDEEDEDGPITIANMEKRSRALDAQAQREAELDALEMQEAELAGQDEDGLDGSDVDMDGDADGEAFVLPSTEEREEQKKSGTTDVHILQRRIREIVRILGKFKKLADPNRSVFTVWSTLLVDYCTHSSNRSRSEYIAQLMADIASYYGYNEFLTEKLFQLFPTAEVGNSSWNDKYSSLTLFT
jgi:25S rRNA (cytosine2870-C5)-methyltransferase